MRNPYRNGWADYEKKATECKYQEYDRRLQEQFRNGQSVETITDEIIKELIAVKGSSKVSSKQVLVWAKRVEVLRVQKAVLDNTRNAKMFTHYKEINKVQVTTGSKKKKKKRL